ncbi:MAG TPA: hypothetical protein VMZ22_01720 [Acidimicrobiales bacterium]|nr:hypothetical protein [Acidimicrobiales bacterium]
MTDEARRKILQKVAAGQMDPGEAADALAALDAPAAAPDAEVYEERTITVDATPGKRVKLVRVDANFRPVEIVGDAGVQEAVAEGTHRIRWEGDTLVIDGATGFDDDDDAHGASDFSDFGEWFRTFGPHVRTRGRSFSYSSVGDYKPRPLRVRMNPDVSLEARVEAGPLKIVHVHGPIKARVAAGPLKIEDFESPIDVRVAAGKVDASGRLDHGESTIDCDAGKVRLHLTHGSHARVSASATLGKVDFGGRGSGKRRDYFDGGIRGDLADLGGLGEKLSSILNNAFSDEHEVVVGRGTATIDIRVSMGAADITFEDSADS